MTPSPVYFRTAHLNTSHYLQYHEVGEALETVCVAGGLVK